MTKKLIKVFKSQTFARGVVALLGFIVIWEFLSKYVPLLTGITLPWIGHVPPPTEVIEAWSDVVFLPGYWESWYMSSVRVFAGFIMAQIIGIPFGLALAVNRYFKDIFFLPLKF